MFEAFYARYLLFLAIFVFACVYIARKVKDHYDIKALGGYAPKVPSILPLGEVLLCKSGLYNVDGLTELQDSTSSGALSEPASDTKMPWSGSGSIRIRTRMTTRPSS